MELLFFSYSFLGWVWECLYVSLRRREWINRGFLRGPWLPIYGTGAVLILLATLPVRESGALVFLLGMVTATALEYVTGAAIEKIFHVRYWITAISRSISTATSACRFPWDGAYFLCF